jgi:hypothetical protein
MHVLLMNMCSKALHDIDSAMFVLTLEDSVPKNQEEVRCAHKAWQCAPPQALCPTLSTLPPPPPLVVWCLFPGLPIDAARRGSQPLV